MNVCQSLLIPKQNTFWDYQLLYNFPRSLNYTWPDYATNVRKRISLILQDSSFVPLRILSASSIFFFSYYLPPTPNFIMHFLLWKLIQMRLSNILIWTHSLHVPLVSLLTAEFRDEIMMLLSHQGERYQADRPACHRKWIRLMVCPPLK